MSESDLPTISVIIPTTCASNRASLVRRAVDSIVRQREVAAEIVVVANGPAVDSDLLASVALEPSVRIIRRDEGDVQKARLAGRGAVRAPLFAFLDDDDELLPGALAHRVQLLRDQPTAAVAITNGVRRRGDDERRIIDDMAAVARDPWRSLIERTWLLSCSGTFRTAAVSERPFANCHRYFEWTSIAFMLLEENVSFVFSDVSTYRVNDTVDSLSKSTEYLDFETGMLEDVRARARTRKARRLVGQKLADAYHARSDRAMREAQLLAAWRWHLRSLSLPGGLRYLAYTRHLFAG